MREILVFGNRAVQGDDLALRIADELKKDKNISEKFTFIESHPDDLLDKPNRELMLMDVANVEDVTLLEGAEYVKTSGTVTAHELNLGFYLKLLEKTGELGKVRIIAVPRDAEFAKSMTNVKKLVNTL